MWEFIAATNKYIVQVEPWVLAKQAKESGEQTAAVRLATSLYMMAESLRLIAHYLVPFLPDTATALAHQLGVTLETDADEWGKALGWGKLRPGLHVQISNILYVKQ